MTCSRKACDSKRARWTHTQSGLRYCGACARRINRMTGIPDLVVRRTDAVTLLGRLAEEGGTV